MSREQLTITDRDIFNLLILNNCAITSWRTMGSHYHLWPLCSIGERVGVKSRLCKTLVLTRAIQVHNFLTFVNTTAIAYGQRIRQSLMILVICNTVAVVFTNIQKLRVLPIVQTLLRSVAMDLLRPPALFLRGKSKESVHKKREGSSTVQYIHPVVTQRLKERKNKPAKISSHYAPFFSLRG